jgi:hypothetical protein
MGSPTPYQPEPDSPSGLRMTFSEPVCGGALIGGDFEVLGVDVNGDVVAIVDVRTMFELGTHDPFEDLLPAFGQFGGFFGHDIGTRL